MITNFCDLPTEIWLVIAQCLTKSELFQLKSVNSFFLNCWMDSSWKHVLVEINDCPERAVRLLERMVDPFVAVRTKRLCLDLEEPTPSSSSNPIFDTIRAAPPLLPNMTDFDINVFKASTIHVVALLQTITSSSIARTLRKLILIGNVTMEMLVFLAEYSAHKTPFESLIQFTLQLSPSNNSIIQTDPLRLEPFLRSIAPNLQILHTASMLDLFPLYNALLQPDTAVIFPKLGYLALNTLFNTPSRSSLQSLRRFLLIHNNVQYLHLNFYSDPDNEERLGAWLADLTDNSQFPCLQSLDIYPSTTQAGLSAVLTLIKLTASTLSSLTILKRNLTLEEAKQVADALTVQVQGTTTTPSTEEPKRLKSLSMNLTQLSVSILNLLAHKFPQLEDLSLTVSEIIGSDQYSFCDLLNHRRYNPKVRCTQDVLHTWKLQELSILRIRDDEIEMDAVRAVAGAIPALSRAMGLDKRRSRIPRM